MRTQSILSTPEGPRKSGKEPSREILEALLEPVCKGLLEVRRIYSASFLSTGASSVSDDIFLDERLTPPANSSFSHSLVANIAGYMLTLEGKWLRPALVLLTMDLFNAPSERGASVAAGLELLHNATLIHDDIIDESDIRRGRHAIWKRWGSPATVLMGDLLYAKAMELIVSIDYLEIPRVIARATARMCQGELHQLQWAGDLKVTEAEYLQVVNNKTACLLSACTQCGAMIAGAPPEAVERMRRFGLHLGMAFQIVDDVLDFVADPGELGKAVGNDVAHGKVTLPLIHFLAHSPHSEAVIALITGRNGKNAVELSREMQSTGSIQYARDVASHYGEEALRQLEELERTGASKDKLNHLARLVDFVVHRRF
jgi:octaprenyl-diphosphate synthase